MFAGAALALVLTSAIAVAAAGLISQWLSEKVLGYGAGGLFLALGYWNEWYLSSLYLGSTVEFKPLQYHLYNIINTANALRNSVAGSNVSITNLPSNTLKMASAIVAIGPILLLYLFGTFSAADVIYAPVVSRFLSYGIGVPGFAQAYMQAVWEHEWMQQWITAAEAEDWVIEQYEAPVAS